MFFQTVRGLDDKKDALGRRIGYAEQFRELQENEARQKNKVGIVEGKKTENREKNRYRNIVPYDKFRVQLGMELLINVSNVILVFQAMKREKTDILTRAISITTIRILISWKRKSTYPRRVLYLIQSKTSGKW